MGTTVIGQPAVDIPLWVGRGVVDLKQKWADDWQYRPELEVVSMENHSAASGIGSMTFQVRYGGDVKFPWDAGFHEVKSEHFNNWWARVRIVGEDAQAGEIDVDATFTAFVGRVSAEGRHVFQAKDEAGGRQDWVAYDGLRILQRIEITRSHWLDRGVERIIDWIPDFNARDARRQLVGNRSASRFGGAYIYDAANRNPTFPHSNLWSRHDALEYLVNRFVDESATDGPAWSISGDALAALKGEVSETSADDEGDPGPPVIVRTDLSADVFRMQPRQSALEAIAAIITPEVGVDWVVKPTLDGFEINVFALEPEEESTAGDDVTLPRNTQLVEVTAGEVVDLIRNLIVHTEDRRFNSVRIIGRRMVTCCTLRGIKAAADGVATLVPGWSPALEVEYEAGTGTPSDSARDHDEVRKSDRFRTVYAMFRAPDDWDLNSFRAAFQADGDGTPRFPVDTKRIQRTVRSTLTWTPLEEGVDYEQNPPDTSKQLPNPEFLPPLVYLRNQIGTKLFGTDIWVNAEDIGIHVSVLRNDWGVFLSASPNHNIALTQFDSSTAPTQLPPAWDYDDMIVTLAFELDTRFELRFEANNPNEDKRNDNELVIEAPDAEMWWLAGRTVVGLDAKRQPILRPTGVLLRDDTKRLRVTMAGARARHLTERGRAAITFNGVLAASGLLGQILTVVQAGGDTHQIQSAITSATWQFGPEPTTSFSAGYA